MENNIDEKKNKAEVQLELLFDYSIETIVIPTHEKVSNVQESSKRSTKVISLNKKNKEIQHKKIVEYVLNNVKRF